jgi:sulfate transport system permease protein
MAISSPSYQAADKAQPKQSYWSKISLPWVVTIVHLSIVLLLPMAALITKSLTVGPRQFWEVATQPVAISAYEVSFLTAFFACTINGVMGTIIAWVLVRYQFPGKKIIDATIDIPFALPTSVAGLVLAALYTTNGWIGQLVAPWEIRIAFTRLGVLIAMLFISIPFVVRTVQPVLMELEPEIEEAAWSLGASPRETFRRVLLPILIPSILTGVALGFARAVGEYGTVVLIASSIPFKDLIAPILVLQRLEQYDYGSAAVIGTVLLMASLMILLLINLLQQWSRRYAD